MSVASSSLRNLRNIVCIYLIASCTAYSQVNYYVDSSRSDNSGAGTNWLTAKRTIQAAVDIAPLGSIVWVTNGVYAEGTAITPGLALSNRVVINKAITVQSVNGPEFTTIRGGGTRGNTAIRCVYLGSNATLSGFTLNGGNTRISGINFDQVGGGVIARTNALVTNCIVTGSFAIWGGGIYLDQGRVYNTFVSGNVASNSGGGLYLNTHYDVAEMVTAESNQAQWGGGIYVWTGGVVRSCTVRFNIATNDGGGIYLGVNGVVTGGLLQANTASWGGGALLEGGKIVNALVSGNEAYASGGGVYLETGFDVVDSVTVESNLAHWGGGIYSETGGAVRYCMFRNNEATRSGGAIHLNDGGVVLNSSMMGNRARKPVPHWSDSRAGAAFVANGYMANCLIMSNSADGTGGIVVSTNGIVVNTTVIGNVGTGNNLGGVEVLGGSIRNSIMWDNAGTNLMVQSAGTASFCLSPDGLTHGVSGNLTNNPLFVSSTTNSFLLRRSSPAFNAGSNQYAPTNYVKVDLGGYPRIMGSSVDMGAYEWPGPHALLILGTNGQQILSGDAASVGNGTDFGIISNASTVTRWLTVSNAGPTNIVLSATLTNNVFNAPAFTLTGLPTNVPPGTSTNVGLVFSSDRLGVFSATLLLGASYGDSPFQLNIAASRTAMNVAQPWGINVAGTLNFGNQPVGLPTSRVVSVTSGTSTLRVTRVNAPLGFSTSWLTNTIRPNTTSNLIVTFTSAATGSYTGILSLESDATSGVAMISCSATTIPATRILRVSPQYPYWGEVFLGHRSNLTLTLYNDGNSPINIQSLSVGDDGGYGCEYTNFIIFGLSSSVIAPSSSVACTAQFRPTAVNGFCAKVNLTSNADNGEPYWYLGGYGKPPVSSIGTTNTEVYVHKTACGYSLPIVIANDNDGAIYDTCSVLFSNLLTRIYDANPRNQIRFGSVSNMLSSLFCNCSQYCWPPVGVSLDPNFYVNYGWRAVLNNHGSINVSHIDGDECVDWTPWSDAIRDLIPPGWNGGCPVSNPGKMQINIGINEDILDLHGNGWSSADDLLLQMDTNRLVTWAVAQDEFGGSFTNRGFDIAVVTGTPSRVIRLSGNLNYGDVPLSQSLQANLTIHNDGNVPLIVTNMTLAEGYSGAWTGSVSPGASRTIPITFSPTAVTTYDGDIVVHSDADSGTNRIACTGRGIAASRVIRLSGNLNYGDVPLSQSRQANLSIQNDGNVPLIVTNMTLPEGFSGAWTGSVSPGTSRTIPITFSPITVTTYGGDIVVHSDANSGTNRISCTGRGIAATRIIHVSTNLLFPKCTAGQTATAGLTISNSGNSTLTVQGLSLPPGFVGSWQGTVATNRSTNIVITFAPPTAGVYTGYAVIASDATSGSGASYLSATGIPHTKTLVITGSLDFGSVPTGAVKSAILTFYNAGNGTVTVDRIETPGTFTSTCSVAITPGKYMSASVDFSPLRVADYMGVARVIGDQDDGPIDLRVRGSGVEAVPPLLVEDYSDGDYTNNPSGVSDGLSSNESLSVANETLNYQYIRPEMTYAAAQWWIQYDMNIPVRSNTCIVYDLLIKKLFFFPAYPFAPPLSCEVYTVGSGGNSSVRSLKYALYWTEGNWVMPPTNTWVRRQTIRVGDLAGVAATVTAVRIFINTLDADIVIDNIAVEDIASSGGDLGYDAYAEFITNVHMRGYGDTPAADGQPNLIRYATGANPASEVGFPALDLITTESNGLMLNLYRNTNALDVIFSVDSTTNLLDANAWQSRYENRNGVWSPMSGVSETEGSNPVSVRIQPHSTTNMPGLFRLRAIRP